MNLRDNLYRIVIDSDTKNGRRFDIFIQTLIFLSLISFSIETLPNLNEDFLGFLSIFETISVVVFSIEYILRVILTKSSIRYIFSFYGIIDLAAILPFYIASGIDLRSVRLFRMLRLFRILKLFKYSKSINNMTTAFHTIKKSIWK